MSDARRVLIGWLTPHLAPLAASWACGRVRVVSNDPVPRLEGVDGLRPSPLTVKLLREASSSALRSAARFTVAEVRA